MSGSSSPAAGELGLSAAAMMAREAEAARQQAAMYKYTLGKVVDDVREKFGKKRAAVGGAEDVESGEHVRSRTPYGQAGASGGATGDEDP